MFTQVDTLNLTPALTGLKYDAASSGPRRRSVYVSTRSEDRELPANDRQSLISQGRDLMRNLTLAGFAVRKNNQNVATLKFTCSIPGQEQYSEIIKKWMYRWSRASNCDLARRHSLSKLLVLIETHRVVDGDVGIIKHSNGRLQIVEGDRIRNPPGQAEGDYEWIHGVKVGNKTGQAFKYAIHKRLPGGGFEFEREVQADNMILCGYYNRLDQARGVPPLAPAIMTFQHIYEGIEYALAKAKLCQMFGLLTKTGGEMSINSREEDDEREAAQTRDRDIKEKFGSGTLHLNLLPDEDAQVIETGTPSTEFQSFITTVIRVAFASLDIPYSMFDASIGKFYGVRGELDGYIESCKDKQERLIEMMDDITDWRLRMAIMDGELPLPPNGMSVDDVLWWCGWRGAGLPLWRLIEDAKGYAMAMRNGLIDAKTVAAMHGGDFAEIITELESAVLAAKAKNLSLDFSVPLQNVNTGM